MASCPRLANPRAPSAVSAGPAMNWPIWARRRATTIIAAIIGTEITPFTTALQNRALIGSIPDQVSARPSSTDAAITE